MEERHGVRRCEEINNEDGLAVFRDINVGFFPTVPSRPTRTVHGISRLPV